MQVTPVRTSRELREFVFLPETLYRGDPLWAPPLWGEERRTFSPRNPVLARSAHTLLLAREGGRTAGRVLAYVDPAFNRHYGSATGFIGSFEAAGAAAAGALLEAAERWLAERGMGRVRGPINPVSECWGLVVEGFDRPPTFLSPHNPPRYNDWLAARGYAKAKDLLVYEADARDFAMPERFSRFRRALLTRRPSIAVRRLDRRRLGREAEAVWRISNEAISGNWGYVPLDRGELEAMLRQLAPIADPNAIWFVEDGGRPVGYALGFPDLNVLLRRMRGRLLPFGFLTLLAGLRRLRGYRLFGLAVLPEYQGLGLDVLLYMSLFDALAHRGVHMEANYILEDNGRIRNALEKLGMERTKAYRVYEKPLG